MRARIAETIEPLAPPVLTSTLPFWDFLAIGIGAVALAALVAFGDGLRLLEPVRLVLALVYVLFVPGYCLIAALFPRSQDLDGVERLGLGLGLSVAVVPIVALVISLLPWGIRLWPILVGEYAVTASFGGAALWMRRRISPGACYLTSAVELPSIARWHSLAPVERRVYRILAGALVLTAIAGAWILLAPAASQSTTEFYILGQDGRAETYPRVAVLGRDLTLTAGIANFERDPHTYQIEVRVADGLNATRRTSVLRTGPITLQPGKSREVPVSWRMSGVGDDQEIEFVLLADGKPTPYRELRLWLNVVAPPSASGPR